VHRSLAAALTAAALLWTAALVLSPFALTTPNRRIAQVATMVYGGCGLICHQRPERSFRLAAVQLPVCARCLGLYLSGAAGALAAWPWRRRAVATRHARALFALAAIPTALTLGVEFLGIAYPSNTTRAVSALPLGAAAGWVFVLSLRAEPDGEGAAGTTLTRRDARRDAL
jgi:uncharacterized membrane protein